MRFNSEQWWSITNLNPLFFLFCFFFVQLLWRIIILKKNEETKDTLSCSSCVGTDGGAISKQIQKIRRKTNIKFSYYQDITIWLTGAVDMNSCWTVETCISCLNDGNLNHMNFHLSCIHSFVYPFYLSVSFFYLINRRIHIHTVRRRKRTKNHLKQKWILFWVLFFFPASI